MFMAEAKAARRDHTLCGNAPRSRNSCNPCNPFNLFNSLGSVRPFGPIAPNVPLFPLFDGRVMIQGWPGIDLAGPIDARRRLPDLDRKSTRLNSSHLGI